MLYDIIGNSQSNDVITNVVYLMGHFTKNDKVRNIEVLTISLVAIARLIQI